MATACQKILKKFKRNTHYINVPAMPFVKRFLNRNDPDFNDYMQQRAMGEFSVHTDIAFENHLRKLHAVFKGS